MKEFDEIDVLAEQAFDLVAHEYVPVIGMVRPDADYKTSVQAFHDGYRAAQPQWIDISEYVEEPRYNVRIKGGDVIENCVCESGYWWAYEGEGFTPIDQDVTHFMPIEPAPKGVEG